MVCILNIESRSDHISTFLEISWLLYYGLKDLIEYLPTEFISEKIEGYINTHQSSILIITLFHINLFITDVPYNNSVPYKPFYYRRSL